MCGASLLSQTQGPMIVPSHAPTNSFCGYDQLFCFALGLSWVSVGQLPADLYLWASGAFFPCDSVCIICSMLKTLLKSTVTRAESQWIAPNKACVQDLRGFAVMAMGPMLWSKLSRDDKSETQAVANGPILLKHAAGMCLSPAYHHHSRTLFWCRNTIKYDTNIKWHYRYHYCVAAPAANSAWWSVQLSHDMQSWSISTGQQSH